MRQPRDAAAVALRSARRPSDVHADMDNVAIRLLALFASVCVRRLYRADRAVDRIDG